jgi:hypothetical protein
MKGQVDGNMKGFQQRTSPFKCGHYMAKMYMYNNGTLLYYN